MVLDTVATTAVDVRTNLSDQPTRFRAAAVVTSLAVVLGLQQAAGAITDADSAALTLFVGLPVIVATVAALYVLVAGGYDLAADLVADQ